jgi:hypothetical protein
MPQSLTPRLLASRRHDAALVCIQFKFRLESVEQTRRKVYLIENYKLELDLASLRRESENLLHHVRCDYVNDTTNQLAAHTCESLGVHSVST